MRSQRDLVIICKVISSNKNMGVMQHMVGIHVTVNMINC